MAKSAAKPKTTSAAKSATKATQKAAPAAVAPASTATKAAPPAKVAAYIATLASTPEQRYAGKVWRHLAGHRKSQGTPRGLTPEVNTVIRTRVQEVLA